MAGPHEETKTLLEERPEIEPAVKSLLSADESGPWTFSEVDIDSGTFGEFVSRGIVERDGDTYRLTDPDATRAALLGEAYATTDENTARDGNGLLQASFSNITNQIHRDLLIGLTGMLTLVVIFRTITIRNIFRDGRIILPGNDPYHYLYWIEQLARAQPKPGLLEFRAIAAVLGGRASGDPLAYTVGWWATEIVGTDATSPLEVVVWLPVVASVLIGFAVFLIALWTTDDERIAVASVFVFALLPGHALYSGIGFLDHHYLDYVWLSYAILGVTWLARDYERQSRDQKLSHLRSVQTWLVVGLVAVIFAAMSLSWDGSPILFVGLAVYTTARAGSDIRTDTNPLVPVTPLASALGLGFAIAYWIHVSAGWSESLVVFTPALIAGGSLFVASLAYVIDHLDRSPGAYFAIAGASIVPAWVGLSVFAPEIVTQLQSRANSALFGRIGSGIGETTSLFNLEYGVFFGPVGHFGWFLFVALPVLAWVTIRCVREHNPQWLVVSSYATALLTFALIQRRFAGEATVVVAVLAGVGLVYLLSVIDVANRPMLFTDRTERTRITIWPDGISARDGGYAIASVLLVASLSLFIVPAVMDNMSPSDDQAATIEWIDQHADSTAGPDYVLNRWGRNRMFNYGVTGESNSYSYARSNYLPFISGENPDQYANKLEGRVGYVVIKQLNAEAPPGSTHGKLFTAHGSATGAAAGSGRFRLVYVSPDSTLKTFRLVDGAELTGAASANASVTAQTTVPVAGLDEPLTYKRRTTSNTTGAYAVLVSHPGTYTVRTTSASSDTPVNTTVQVTAEDVQNGTRVQV